jgi:hypothetical protein
VTVVKGREVWRLVGAEERLNDSIFIHDITQIIRRFIRGGGTHKALYDRIISFLNKSVNYDEKKAKLLLYYIFLVELGYADAKIIGAKNIKEYIGWSVDDLYTHILLSYSAVHKHVGEVMKEIQL